MVEGEYLPDRSTASVLINGLIPFEEKQLNGSYISKKITYEMIIGSSGQPIILKNQTGTITMDLPANSYLQKIYITYISGTVHITATDGINLNYSQDMASEDIDLNISQKYPIDKTLTLTISGGIVNLRIELLLNYC